MPKTKNAPKLFTLRDVMRRSKRRRRTVYDDRAVEGCPLRWTHKVGREVACTEQVLVAYLEWVESRRVRPIGSAS